MRYPRKGIYHKVTLTKGGNLAMKLKKLHNKRFKKVNK